MKIQHIKVVGTICSPCSLTPLGAGTLSFGSNFGTLNTTNIGDGFTTTLDTLQPGVLHTLTISPIKLSGSFTATVLQGSTNLGSITMTAMQTYNLTFTPTTTSATLTLTSNTGNASSIQFPGWLWFNYINEPEPVVVTICGSDVYRYGYNGKAKDNQWAGLGNHYNFGARLLDPRLGRWLAIDPLAMKYPYASPYSFSLNSPLQAKDPDGKVVLFFNGMNNGMEGGKSKYWNGFDDKIMNRIGDKHAIYRDGSSGGAFNVTSHLDNIYNSDLNPAARMKAGEMQGKKDAAHIIAGLQRSPNDADQIVETIKVVSHSMGTAYARGYTAALSNYVTDYNQKNPDHPLKGFKIEMEVDMAAFQGSQLPVDKNIGKTFFMSGNKDNVANGKGTGPLGKFLRSLSPSSDVPGATQIKTDDGTRHDLGDYDKDKYIQQIPQSNNNSNNGSKDVIVKEEQ